MQIRYGRLQDRRGVALPLALVGLVIVSVLVTAALVSSSTELAVAGAQESATRRVYQAEEALNAYVGRVDSLLAINDMTAPAPPTNPFTLPSGGDATLTMRQVYRTAPTLQPDGTTKSGTAVYCITSVASLAGGRSSRMVGAFLQVDVLNGDLDLSIKGAGSFGGDVTVRGSATIVGQAQNVDKCGTAGAVPAIETSKDGKVVTNGNAVDLVGGTRQTTETKEQFQRRILGGKTPLEIAKQARIKFGPLLTTARNFPASFKATSSVRRDSVSNWGCPASLGVSCSATTADTSYYPVIGIDAQGGQVDLQGDHGQGLLVVVNGGLKITGNFKFKGIILVEGALDVMGTAEVVGSVVGFNTITVSKDNQNDLAGTMDITFDPCVNRRVEQAFNSENPQYALTRPVYGWFEVVR